jgi:hypothetical protein
MKSPFLSNHNTKEKQMSFKFVSAELTWLLHAGLPLLIFFWWWSLTAIIKKLAASLYQ